MKLLLPLTGLLISLTSAEELQTVDEAEFVKLISEETYVVALFCPSSSLERCEEFEGELTSIREDMIDTLDGDAWVVKLLDSPLVHEYAVGKTDQPVIVMFRKGLPVIYDGPANEEVMLETLVRFQLPGVQDLTDTTFDQVTRPTAGDWLVMFYTTNCQLCYRVTAAMETVGCMQRGKSNVARVNKETYGEKTGRRFQLGLEDKLDIILFRQGKMYRYSVEQYDPESITSFVTKTFSDHIPEDIPPPKSPLFDLVQLCLDYLHAFPLLVGACLCVPVLLVVAFLLIMRGEDEPKARKTKKKKKEEQKEKKESKKNK